MKKELVEIYGVLMIQYHKTSKCPYVTQDNKVFITIEDYCKIEGCPKIASVRVEDSEVKLVDGRYQSVPLDPALLCLTLASNTLTCDEWLNIANTFGAHPVVCAEESFDCDGCSDGACLVVKIPILK